MVNNGEIRGTILKKYAAEREYPIENDLFQDPRCIARDVVMHGVIPKQQGDSLERSLLRHDAVKLARVLLSL